LLKWRASDSGWRTLLRHSNHHCAIVQSGTKNLGFYANGGKGGFRDSGYNISPIQARWELLVVTGTSTNGVVGTSTFWAEDQNGVMASVGTSDRVCSGMDYYRIGWSGQSPGKIARVLAWDYVLSVAEISELRATLDSTEASSNKYQFLFNGCPRGDGASSWSMKGNYELSQCQALCDADSSCNAIEVNGCNANPGACGGHCYHFYGNAGGEIHNGNCNTNGDQKTYRKRAPN